MADNFGVQPGRIPAIIAGKKMLFGGDVIIALGGEGASLTADGQRRARTYFDGLQPGDLIEITVFRDGKQAKLTTPKEKPAGQPSR